VKICILAANSQTSDLGGATHEKVEKNMHEAIEMHVYELLKDKLPIPQSDSFAEYVAVH